jgi:hypothetical protein
VVEIEVELLAEAKLEAGQKGEPNGSPFFLPQELAHWQIKI